MTEYGKALNQLIRWENPQTRRYYVCYLHEDMLGDIILTMVNGGIDSYRGRVRHQLCESTMEGSQLINSIHQRRQQRGYSLIDDPGFGS